MKNEGKKNWEEMVEKEAENYMPQAYASIKTNAFYDAIKFAEDNAQHMPKVKALIEALEKNKSEWEAVNPNGHKHMVAWQMTRDALKAWESGE